MGKYFNRVCPSQLSARRSDGVYPGQLPAHHLIRNNLPASGYPCQVRAARVFGAFPAFAEKLRRNPGDMWASVPLSPGSVQKLTPSNFGPGSPSSVFRTAPFFCVTFCHNVTSDLPGCRSDLEPRVFFYCTLLHALRDLLPGRSLGHSPLHRHPFLCHFLQHFNIQPARSARMPP